MREWRRNRGGKARPEKAAPVIGVQNVDALVVALNRSAERIQTLWFTFLTFTLYLAIAAGTTTHRMLFLEEGLTLPILNVKLPLLGFYVVAPVFFVIYHAYFLMMLVLLARSAKAFERTLRKAVPMRAAQERYRMRLENAIFLQLLSGALRERMGRNSAWLRLIATLTLAVLPIVLLLMIQIMFLPYHHDWMTWLHRALIIFDLALIWTLWPAFLYEGGARLMPRLKNYRRNLVNTVLSSLVLIFSITIMTYPGETMNRLGAVNRIGLSTFLFGYADLGLDGPGERGFLPNRLWLPNEVFVQQENLDLLTAKDENGKCPVLRVFSLPLADRDLTGAVLISTDLRKGDFMRAKIAHAYFDDAWLDEARFEVKEGTAASFIRARLNGASFFMAQLPASQFKLAELNKACLNSANLAGASLDYARLKGASLYLAQMQGAWLYEAQMQGAKLDNAQMQGATLIRAQMQGATLIRAQMQGASLIWAQMQGASLFRARMQGALLDGAYLQGALLDEAHLQGATLDRAHLEGASLRNAEMQGASLYGARVWRTHEEPLSMEAAYLSELNHAAMISNDEAGKKEFAGWRQTILDKIPQGRMRDEAEKGRLALLDPGAREPDGVLTKEGFWDKAAARQTNGTKYQKELAGVLEKLACDAATAPYVGRGLIIQREDLSNFGYAGGQLANVGPLHLQTLEKRLKAGAQAKSEEKNDCPGAVGLTEEDLQNLRQLVKEVEEGSKAETPE